MKGQVVSVLFCSLQEPERLWWQSSLGRDHRDSGLHLTGCVALGEAPNLSVILLSLINWLTVPTGHRPHLLGVLGKLKSTKKEAANFKVSAHLEDIAVSAVTSCRGLKPSSLWWLYGLGYVTCPL